MNDAKRRTHHLLCVDPFQCDLRMARLLVIGGCDLEPLWDWAASGVVQWLRDEQVAHVEWLKNVCVNPLRLHIACRMAIRWQMGPERAHLVDRLPLPKVLIDFIQLCDLDYFDHVEVC